ncbi:MAG: RNA methyltransferase [Pseudohongiellaceae bacterium]
MLDNIRVVLVNTSHPGNIGAVARAMKNMGLYHLTLVDPEDFPHDIARFRAVSATDILDNAHVVPDLKSAVSECGLVIGASARSRSMPWPMLDPRQCADRVVADGVNNKVALVFGREKSGLSNEELTLCNYHVQIPTDEAYPSLNLAAATTIILHEVRMACLKAGDDTGTRPASAPPADESHWDVARANGQQMELFYEHLEKVLVDLDFHDPDNPRQLMARMRRMFGRIRPDRMEVNILRGVLTHIEQALNTRKKK